MRAVFFCTRFWMQLLTFWEKDFIITIVVKMCV